MSHRLLFSWSHQHHITLPTESNPQLPHHVCSSLCTAPGHTHPNHSAAIPRHISVQQIQTTHADFYCGVRRLLRSFQRQRAGETAHDSRAVRPLALLPMLQTAVSGACDFNENKIVFFFSANVAEKKRGIKSSRN